MSPKKGSKVTRPFTKVTSRVERQRKCRSYFITKDCRTASYSSSQGNSLLHKYWDFYIKESPENLFEHVWQKLFVQWESTRWTPFVNRASVESFIHSLFTLFSNNMAIGKSLHTEIIDKQEKKIQSKENHSYRVSGEMSNYVKTGCCWVFWTQWMTN